MPLDTRQAGQLGRFMGTNPKIEFDYTSEGIINVKLTVSFHGGTCTIEGKEDKPFTVSESGHFYAGYLSANIEGIITGDSATGTWSVWVCGNTTGKVEGSWSAKLYP
jgi:hypothetical protein